MKDKLLVGIVVMILLVSLSGCINLTKRTDYSTKKVEVVEVIDGDTIEIEWDNGTEDTVRILGIDTPEVHTNVDTKEWEGIDNVTWLREYGYRAMNFTEEWITEFVNLSFDENEGKKGYYGRYLAYVELPNGTDLGAELVKHGLARVYREGDCKRESEYIDYERDAQENEIGVWSNR